MAEAAWPWPDDRLDRYRRIAHIYRDRLIDEAPHAAANVDALMREFGQHWITGRLDTDPDTLLTVRELAEVADVPQSTVRNWVQRWPLHSHGTDRAGHKVYRWGDVLVRQCVRRVKVRPVM